MTDLRFPRFSAHAQTTVKIPLGMASHLLTSEVQVIR